MFVDAQEHPVEADRDRIDSILARLEVLRAGVHELDQLHSSVRAELMRAELERLKEEAAEPLGAE